MHERENRAGRGLAAVAAATLLVSLAACYQPGPVAHARLDVTAAGAFLLQGQPVPGPELQAAVAALRPNGSALVVDISASPEASAATIRFAVRALEAAQARVAFASAR